MKHKALIQKILDITNSGTDLDINSPQARQIGLLLEARKPKGGSVDFERNWKAYGRPVSKKQAKAQWEKLTQEEQELAEKAIPVFAATFTADTNHFKPHMHRWLRDRRFEDEVVTEVPAWTPPAEAHVVSDDLQRIIQGG